jgi:hypothetical protein
MASEPWHLLRSWDALRRPCWLIRAQDLTPSIRRILRRNAELHHHYDAEIGAVVIDREGIEPVKKAFQGHPLFSEWCTGCSSGDPCQRWNLGQLRAEGYGPVESLSPDGQAAARLGVTWPWTPEQVQQAFRQRALRAHPDHGGTDARMRELVTDRDILLERVTRE